MYMYMVCSCLCLCIYVRVQDSTWVCGESWLAIKDLQPTALVFKAGIQASCAQCVCLYVHVHVYGVMGFCLYLAGVLYTCDFMYMYMYMYMYICKCCSACTCALYLLEFLVHL